MNYVNLNQLNLDILSNMCTIPKDIDVFVGVPRSGMIVATLLACYCNKPLSDIDTFVEKKWYSSGNTKRNFGVSSYSDIKKILVVEDSSSSGRSIQEAKQKFKDVQEKIEVLYLAAYVTKETRNNVDIFFRVIDIPRLFEWNFMHHDILEKSCVDLDGVLCIDPSKEENDDGEKYKSFIMNARSKYIPTRKIGWIVTARLEKYRKLTEEWLENNNIDYDHLIMMDEVDTAKERRELGNHARFKASKYKDLKKSVLFIESDQKQAELISQLSGKDVICTGTQVLYSAKLITQVERRIYRLTADILKRILPYKTVAFLKETKKRICS